MPSLLLNPVTRAPFSQVAPSVATFEIAPGALAKLDPAAAPGGYVVRAPSDRYEGACFAVLDTTGAATLHPVTIDGNGAPIDGGSSCVLDTARALGVFVWTGAEWRRVGAPPFLLEAGEAVMAFNRYDPPPAAVVQLIAESATGGEAYADQVAAAAQATAEAFATLAATSAEANAIAASAVDATTKANAAQANAIAAAASAERLQISGIAQAVGTALTAGSFTTATRFFVDRSGEALTGVRFWWPGGASRTIKASIWDAAGVRLASATVAVSAAGFYTVSLAANLTIGVIYRVSLWDTSGISYLKTTSTLANAMVPARAFHAGGGLYYEAITYYAAGDAFPATSGAEAYLMDPIVAP